MSAGSVLLGADPDDRVLSLSPADAAANQLLSTGAHQEVRLQFSGLMAGAGQVAFMKLAFTNPDYLNVFTDANQEAIRAKHVAVVKA